MKVFIFIMPALLLIRSFVLSPDMKISETQHLDTTIHLPLGGNSWVQKNTEKKVLTKDGIENWTSPQISFDTYMRVNRTGTINIGLKAKTDGASKLKLTVNGINKEIVVNGKEAQLYHAGEWKIKDSGYIKITLNGLSKTGERFADITEYEISGTAINAQTAFVKNNEGNFFYWGRRGPSVHLNYPFADSVKAEWFYNEITVPEGQDVIGSYYMANGFGEGYFGIQVNSVTERRCCFQFGVLLLPMIPKKFRKTCA